jgi:HEAT repeat protein
VFAILLLALQNDPASLVEKLRSDRVEEREDATRRLKALGRAAAPALEKAAKDRDAEVAARARQLLRVLELRETLPAKLREALPGVEDRLAAGDDHAWTEAFLEANELDLGPEELRPLLRPAFRGARSEREKREMASAAGRHRLGEAIPDLISFLQDESPRTRRHAAEALAALEARDQAKAIVPLLKHPALGVRGNAADLLGELGARESVPDLLPLLDDAEPHIRWHALQALALLRAPDAAPKAARLLGDADASVRLEAARAIGELGGRDSETDLAALLKDDAPAVRTAAARSLCALGSRKGVPLLLQDARHVHALNALRRPAEWNALRDATMGRDTLHPPLGDLLERIAQAAGLALEGKALLPSRVLSRRTRVSALGVFEWNVDGEWSFVLEEKRLRVLSAEEALAFWKSWWAEEEKKK